MTFKDQILFTIAIRCFRWANWSEMEYMINPFNSNLVDIVLFAKNADALKRHQIKVERDE